MAEKKCDMVINLGKAQWTETHYLPATTTMNAALTALISLSAARSYCFSGQTTFDFVRVSDIGILGDSTIETTGLGGYGDPGLADVQGSAMLVRMNLSTQHRSQLWIRGQPDSWVVWNTVEDGPVWTTDFSRWADSYLDRLVNVLKFGAIVKLKPGEAITAGGVVTEFSIANLVPYPIGEPSSRNTGVTTVMDTAGLVAGDKIVIRNARGPAKIINGTWPLVADPGTAGVVIPVPFPSLTGFGIADLSKAKIYRAIYQFETYTSWARRAIRTKKYGREHDLPRGRARTR